MEKPGSVGFFNKIVEILREDFSPLLPGSRFKLTREVVLRLLFYLAFLIFTYRVLFSGSIHQFFLGTEGSNNNWKELPRNENPSGPAI